MNFKGLIDKSKEKLIRAVRRSWQRIRLISFRTKGLPFRLWRQYSVHVKDLLVICYIAGVMISIVYLIQEILPLSNSNGELTQIYIALGSSLVATIAIVFSVNALLVQSTASRFSAGFHRLFTGRHFLSFFLVFCTLSAFAFFIMSFIYATDISENERFQYWATSGTLVVLALFFPMLALLFMSIRKSTNPFMGILEIQKAAIRKIKKLDSHSKKVSKLLAIKYEKPDQYRGLIRAQVINANQNVLLAIENEIRYLFDFHDKSVAANEKSLALSAIDAATKILSAYLRMRDGASLEIPGRLLSHYSDSQAFLVKNLERLVAIGVEYIRVGDEDGGRYVLAALATICDDASAVASAMEGESRPDNSLVLQCQGYLGSYLDKIMEMDNAEMLFQGAKWLGYLGIQMVERNSDLALSTTLETLKKISVQGIVGESSIHEVAYQETFRSYTAILNKITLSRYYNAHVQVERIFEDLTTLLAGAFTALQDGSIQSSLTTITGVSAVVEGIEQIVGSVYRRVVEQEDRDGRAGEDYILMIELLQEMNKMNEGLAKKIANAEHMFVGSIAESSTNIANALLEFGGDKKGAVHQGELLNLVTRMAEINKSFIDSAPSIRSTSAFYKIVDFFGQVGITAVEKGNDELAKKCCAQIENIATQILTKEKGQKYGNTELRTMMYACYIGIIALKESRLEVLEELKSCIKDFELRYIAQWPELAGSGPAAVSSKEKLLFRVADFRDEYVMQNHRPRFNQDASSLLFELTEQGDVDLFIKNVWSVEVGGRRNTPLH